MAFRFKGGYSAPGVGTVNARKKTKTGPGPAPAGTKKVKARPPQIVTTSPSGQATTQGFPSPRAAQAARKRSGVQRARVRRIERQQASALGFHRRSQQRASQAAAQPSLAALSKRNAPMTTKTVISSRAGTVASAQGSQPHSVPSPSYKPPKFQGAKTAGTPSIKELQVADKQGTIRLNKRGYVTTPAVRSVSSSLKRLGSKARRSNESLPGLTPQQSKNARTVLRRGVKADATKKELLAAAETGLVEAPNFENPAGGDADSEGWRQERTSIYGTGPTGPRNVKASAKRFFEEIRTDSGAATAPTAGLAAQAAQGSAFPERYDERRPEANAIVKAFERGGLKPAQQRKLAQTQVKARKLGLNVSGASSLGPAPPRVVKKFKAAVTAMKQIDAKHFEYQWGGGHTGVAGEPVGGPGPGFDCSGAVSAMLHSVGALDTPLTSGDMGQALKPGPGAITVFYNSVHTFAYIPALKKYWGTSTSNVGGGAGFFPKSVGDAEVASGNSAGSYAVGHVPGLGKKQAAQMGVNNLGPGAQPFPGMTVSPGGTTATINPSSGTTQEKAGFSKSPIKLTQNQKAHRTLKKLAQLGAGVGPKAEVSSEDKASILAGLERKYGKKAA